MTIITKTEAVTVTYNVEDWAALALAVEKRVMAKLQKDLASWPDDLSMRSMIVADAADGMAVCESLYEGDWRDVEKKLWHMDTAPRDWIWEYLEAELGVDELEFIRQNNG